MCTMHHNQILCTCSESKRKSKALEQARRNVIKSDETAFVSQTKASFLWFYITLHAHYSTWKHVVYMSHRFPHLCSFPHFSLPLCLPPSLPSPTVFLPVSCLESQPAGQPRAHKFVSGSVVEREATCLGGSGASALTWGLFLTAGPRLLFQARPL